ncbi:protein of unknown function [Ruminococcaceae bacterium BL-4]|nr:protein of unknown function [Ruminococcaceae bacterium BL-4]
MSASSWDEEECTFLLEAFAAYIPFTLLNKKSGTIKEFVLFVMPDFLL